MPTPLRRVLHSSRGRAACLLWLGALGACDDFEPPHTQSPAAVADAGGTKPPVVTPDGGASPLTPAVDASAPRVSPVANAAANGSHVFVTNPREHAITVVDAKTLAFQQVPCADAPTLIGSSDRAGAAIAVDVAAETGCVVSTEGSPFGVVTLSVVPHANAVAISPDGRFALVYHDRRRAGAAGTGARDTQEVSVIRLDADATSATVLVGLRPREVSFSADGETAFVTSDGGVSVISLAGAAKGALPSAPPRGANAGPWLRGATVRVATEGMRAIAFARDGGVLLVIDLRSGAAAELDLTAWATLSAEADAGVSIATPRIADAAIAPSGARVFIALRGEQSLLEAPLPAALGVLSSLTLHPLPGQPTDRVLLSGATDARLLVVADAADDARATLLPIAPLSGSLRVPLAAAPDTLLAAADGSAFTLVHGPHDGLPTGYTTLRAVDGVARFSQTSAAPIAVAMSDTASAVALSGEGDESPRLEITSFATLASARQPLTDAPLAAGFTQNGRQAFALVQHPDGRLVLVNVESGETRTLTGFLIADRGEESAP